MAKGRHGRRFARGGLKVALVAVGALALLGGGTAYAAYRYDASTADRILPGVAVAGVDVSDMTRDEAVEAVTAKAAETLDGELSVRAGNRSWTVTPAELGMSADVEGAVDRAFALADDLSFLSRVYHRVAEKSVHASLSVPFAYDDAAVQRFVEGARDEVAVPAVDARFVLGEDGLVMRRPKIGRALRVQGAAERIRTALEEHAVDVRLPIRDVRPEVTVDALGNTIVVDLSENALRFYDGFKVQRQYPVATAAPGYETPVGNWKVIDKKENPTWYNPALDSWGADLPPVIEPGPNNPLGTRALYLNSPGIRIHGTSNSASIGTYASHGCIRMFISDSEELYPLVPVGTRVIIMP
ncbi:MAG TPA: L,D-transpeptidase/peptidoglycan binding protein [Actinomycetota bacterium]|nr:L,D-transpeptidase/peptidoglycan binding protein [Actinomycetota bacterium]